MPLTTAPNLIEASNFTAGWFPDGEPAGVPAQGLLDVKNFLMEITTGSLVTRKGFKRVAASIGDSYKVMSIHPYQRLPGMTAAGDYLIVVITNGTADQNNNVQVYSLALSTMTLTKISPVDLKFPTATGRHWGATVNGVFYGGGDGKAMYSWDPTTGWTSDVSVPAVDTLVQSQTPGENEVAYDFAFQKGDRCKISTTVYSAHEGFERIPWHVGTEYEKRDIVTRKCAITGGGTYRRAWRCKKDHTANTDNRPGDGTDGTWQKHWKPMRLSWPLDDDNQITEDWDLYPTAALTEVGTWHGERLWLRYDNVGNIGKARLQYSAPSKPKKGSDISELFWDPKKFQLETGQTEGEGGGWLPIGEGDGDPITGLLSYGYYLLIFKRRETYVLAGWNRNTWVLRGLGEYGCVGPRAACIHEELAYFLSDEGLFYTDGTQVKLVPGSEKFNQWLRATALFGNSDVTGACVWSFGGYVWVSVPTTGGTNDVVVCYHPASESLWKLDLKVSAAGISKVNGMDELFFGRSTDARALVYRYNHPDCNNADDDGAATYGAAAIAFLARTAWYPFGSLREERRIRRSWALLRGNASATANFKFYRNFSNTAAWTKGLTPTSTVPAYYEGQVAADSYAANFELSGSGAPLALLALAVETQPRRVRYH